TVYAFVKEGGQNKLYERETQKADLHFTIPKAAADELVTKSFDGVGKVGLFIFEKITAADPAQKIKVKLNTGFLSLLTGGYMGVLTSGGADVAKFLASRGLGSLGKLKETISRLRGE